MAEQPVARPTPAEGFAAELWAPADLSAMPDCPHDDALFVTVDDVDDNTAVIVAAPWPRQDGDGRLRFGGVVGRSAHRVRRTSLQEVVERFRSRHGKHQPGRRVRVGDVFYVRLAAVPGATAAKLGMWREAVDVSDDARAVASSGPQGAPRSPADAATRLPRG